MTIVTAFNGKELYKLLTKGYFAVNKPKNVSSMDVLEQLKSVLKRDIPVAFQPQSFRLGHGGTLDYTATGVLVVGIGWGCKLLPLLLHGDKKYVATGHFGVATDTYNETGKITQKMKYDHITKKMLETALEKYTGNIHQIPPKYSALKFNGTRVGDWTRYGANIEMKPRPVECYSIQCTKFSPPEFTIEVACGGGFYVRSLVHDVGQALSSCAHVTALHRVMHGPFTEEDTLEQPQWNGHNITKAILEAQVKFDSVLQRHKVKGVKNRVNSSTSQFKGRTHKIEF